MGLIPTISMLTPDGDKANIGESDLQRYLDLGWAKDEAPEAPAEKPTDENPAEKPSDELLPE